MKEEEIQQFIRLHQNDDPRRLALSGDFPEGADRAYVLDQIQGWQTARHKLPTWAAIDGLVYPPHLSMEQCSSEATARYKQQLMARAMGKDLSSAQLADLTGGFGVDFSFLSQSFGKAVYVERQEHLCHIARHNFQLLGLTHAEVVCGDGTEWLHEFVASGHRETRTAIYLDPARRDVLGRKVADLSSCQPDVTMLLPLLRRSAEVVLVKLSPMFDWHAAVAALAPSRQGVEVHIVSVGGECKELLVLLTRTEAPLRVFCVNDDSTFSYEPTGLSEPSESPLECSALPLASASTLPLAHGLGSFLFVPHASIMKAGCFAEVSQCFKIPMVDRESHLFVAETDVPDFPGRRFRIRKVVSMNKKELREALTGITHANVSTRHFPLSADALRKKLKLKDGGSLYLFATTWRSKHILMFCERI
jgi:16S rRNA G966 N2-methylase RsmD